MNSPYDFAHAWTESRQVASALLLWWDAMLNASQPNCRAEDTAKGVVGSRTPSTGAGNKRGNTEMNQPANLRVRRRVIVLIVAAWISAAVWTPGIASAAPGDVLKSWVVAVPATPFGVGYNTGRLWISNVVDPDIDYEFTIDGVPTGQRAAAWVGTWIADMTYLPGPKLLCQVNVGGDKGIYCWNSETGAMAGSIVGAFPWTLKSQRGLAYRAADDTFYIGGWVQGIIYRIKGLSYADRGAVLSQCIPPDPNISGLAYNAVFNVLWAATNGENDTIYALDPDTCAIVPTLGLNGTGTLPHPDPGFNGAGLEMDENGNLWMVSQGSARAFLIASGLSASPPSVASISDVVDAMPDAAFRNLGLRRAFEARLTDILRSIDAGNTVPAVQMLRNLRMRTDGCGAAADRDDWIVDCGCQSAVRPKMNDLIKKLGG